MQNFSIFVAEKNIRNGNCFLSIRKREITLWKIRITIQKVSKTNEKTFETLSKDHFGDIKD